ncbi:MAG: aminoacetone oxidase family FAD-binding enzyme, partial [Bacilli bacterium]
LVIATGGQTYQALGSDGSGYALAQSFNHTITKLIPQECPIMTPVLKDLQGIALEKVSVSICNSNLKVYQQLQGPLLFTHFGLSGPVILNTSFMINELLAQDITPFINLNLLNLDYEQTKTLIYKLINDYPNRLLKNTFNLLPMQLTNFLLLQQGISTIKNNNLSKVQIKTFISSLYCLSFPFLGFYKPEFAFVTGGGLPISEVKPKTLESKLVNNLYFGGEFLAVSCYLGGYNITLALSCGYNIAQAIISKSQ